VPWRLYGFFSAALRLGLPLEFFTSSALGTVDMKSILVLLGSTRLVLLPVHLLEVISVSDADISPSVWDF
jgi:hypothetical protein